MKEIPSKTCIICNEIYFKKTSTSKDNWNNSKYCSHRCQLDSLSLSVINRTCEYCGKRYRRQNGQHEQRFCSRSCAGKGTDWTKRPQYVPEAHNGANKTCDCGCGTIMPMYDNKFRMKRYVLGHQSIGKSKPKTPEQIEKHRRSLIAGGKVKGEKHWNWKGGISEPMKALRRTKEYDDWRFAVYKRDNYFCQECGIKTSSGTIVAHHLSDFRNNPELRYSIPNGITLCRKCHIKIHKY